MQIDWYTKGVLTVIAALLALMVVREYVGPVGLVQAQGAFVGVQALSWNVFFDSRTGEIWIYNGGDGPPTEKHRLTMPGGPMVEVNRDRGEPRGSAPPTPPDMRVRIRRFGELSYSRTVNLGIPSESK